MITDKYMVNGKIALIVGSAMGQGKAIALALAQGGADISLADINEKCLPEVTEQIRKLGRRCVAIPTDVSKEDQITRAVEQTILEYGRIDILSYNVGIVHSAPVAYIPGAKFPGWENTQNNWDKPMTLKQWNKIMDTNLTGAFLFAQAVGPHMLKQKKGKVIIIGSISAEEGTPYQASYNVSKAGIHALVRTLGAEWALYNINVNAIGPGPVDTAFFAPFIDTPENKEASIGCIPMKRLGKPDEIALLALYLASEASNFCTGAVFYIDGGCMGLNRGV